MSVFRSTAIGIAVGTLPLALAACDEGPATNVTYKMDDVWQVAQAVMASGPLLVLIDGAPYGGEAPRLAESVVEDMETAITWYATPRFTAEATEAASTTLRIVMTFNGGSTLSSRGQCRGRASGGEPLDNGRVEVIATFCDDSVVLANVRGWIGRSESASDPRFSSLIRQATRDMFTKSTSP